ncbi:sulfite exporter TauE/SafE family protein [Shouchella shacheensis]|uniref:sulfite exporter TauE/SafE family protein n=1 Tax=Shouchella shacheensis TaxID=1649580 RepID=UPI00073FF56F|nr:sulfite exporter TauE/SafE family protein [Shouchella shacheensis]
MEWILLVIMGLVAGTFGSLLGLGGGLIVVPALIMLGSQFDSLAYTPPQVAAGTSLFVMIFTGISSTLSYLKQKTVDYKSAFLFFVGIAPGTVLGVIASRFVDTELFFLYFGLFMLVVVGSLFLRGNLRQGSGMSKGVTRSYIDETGERQTYGYRPSVAISLSVFIGFVSSLFGVGGGALVVPVMIVLFGFPARTAVATSMLVIFLSAVSGSVSHLVAGHIAWLYALALIPGAWFGGQLGAWMNRKLSSAMLVHVLRVMFLLLALRFVYQGITGSGL